MRGTATTSVDNAARFRRLPFGVPDPRADQVMVRMRDGVRLATDVYLPTEPSPVPAIVVRLPYDKSGEFSFMAPVAQRLVDRGYAVVVQDVRGKVRSEGETRAFVHEVHDGYDTIDWTCGQTWCDGTVGMFGDSYYGFTQWAAQASGHPALRAMVPRMTTTEVGTDWMYNQGVFNVGTMVEWAVHAWAENALLDHRIDWTVRPLVDVVPTVLQGRRSASLDTWWPHSPDDRYWIDAVYAGARPRPGRIPTLHVGGFYDVFSRGQLRDHSRALRGALPADQFLEMGATDHFDDELSASGQVDDYATDPGRLAAFLDHRYLPLALDFLDRYLHGRDRSLPRVRWELGLAGWRESTSWPPPQARPLTLYPCDAAAASVGPQGGALSPRPDRVPATLTWVHDPLNPVPSMIEDPWRPLLRLPDERTVQARDDVVTFTGETSPEPLDLAGPVRVVADLQADSPAAHLVARLTDVAPTGESRLIVEGAALVPGSDEGRTVVVDLGDTGYRVAVGHRLRLSLAASSYPRWAVHPGTADHPFLAVTSRVVTHRVRVGGTAGLRLLLTVLPASPPLPTDR